MQLNLFQKIIIFINYQLRIEILRKIIPVSIAKIARYRRQGGISTTQPLLKILSRKYCNKVQKTVQLIGYLILVFFY